MSIAQSDPENPVSKQIMAAAEHVPAPLMPVAPDVYTEVLSFVTAVSQLVAKLANKEELKPLIEPLGNVKQLLSKLGLHRPQPEPAEVLAGAKEELRKRNKRLAKKNGQALGSASYNPPTNGTAQPEGTSTNAMKPVATPIDASADGVSKRYHMTEHTIGSLTKLVIMDGNKVHDWYSLDERQEAQEMLDKLNESYNPPTNGTAKPEGTSTNPIPLENLAVPLPMDASPVEPAPAPAPSAIRDSSPVVYDAGEGVKVREVTNVATEQVKYVTCVGTEQHPYPSLEEAQRAADVDATRRRAEKEKPDQKETHAAA